MSGTDGEAEVEPLLQPRLVEFLKDRPRLIDRGVRRDFLEQLEINIRERRKPDTVAEQAVHSVVNRVEEAGTGVARDRAKKRLEKANDGVLNKL